MPIIAESELPDPWIIDMRASVRTAADFVIAQVTDAPNVVEAAGRVLCWTDGAFIAVSDIESKCNAHGWNSMIYEAWVWARRIHVFVAANKLVSHERDALLLYADSRESLHVSQADANDALEEARRALYGDEADFEGLFDFDDDDDDFSNEVDAQDVNQLELFELSADDGL